MNSLYKLEGKDEEIHLIYRRIEEMEDIIELLRDEVAELRMEQTYQIKRL